MIHSWILMNEMTTEWMLHFLSFINSDTIWPLYGPQHLERKPLMYDTAPWLLVWYSQWFKQTRPGIFRWITTSYNFQSMWNLSKNRKERKEKKKKEKTSLAHPIKKRNLSAGNSCHQNSGTECLLMHAEHCRKKRRKGSHPFAVGGIFLKKSCDKNKTENPTELGGDTWSTRKGKGEMIGAPDRRDRLQSTVSDEWAKAHPFEREEKWDSAIKAGKVLRKMTNGIPPYCCINGEQTINKSRIEDMTAEIGIRKKRALCGAKQTHAAHDAVSNLNLLRWEPGVMMGLISRGWTGPMMPRQEDSLLLRSLIQRNG